MDAGKVREQDAVALLAMSFGHFNPCRERKNLGNCSMHCPTTVRPVHIIPAYTIFLAND
ncbi:MAG: hypothetical protein KAJ32_00040 [Gammaproteobacteria bacterium]|nr:hypothetical protein [Gammaproteobacteria bacterium]